MELSGAISNCVVGKGKAAGGGEEEPPSDNNKLPRSCIARMMRRVLEPQVKISGSAKDVVKNCAAEFINVVVHEAGKRCNQDERRMLTPEDITWALRNLGLGRYVEPMGTYLIRYREAAASGSGAPAAVGDLTESEEELLRILAQMMNNAGRNNSS